MTHKVWICSLHSTTTRETEQASAAYHSRIMNNTVKEQSKSEDVIMNNTAKETEQVWRRTLRAAMRALLAQRW
jgi:Flp pilus assembly secretin CpaC